MTTDSVSFGNDKGRLDLGNREQQPSRLPKLHWLEWHRCYLEQAIGVATNIEADCARRANLRNGIR